MPILSMLYLLIANLKVQQILCQSQHKEVYFNQAEFQKTVNFSGGIFEKVNFLKTVFYSSIDFSRATFTQEFNLNDNDLQQAESIFF